jgi:hypothetical protein
MRKVGRLAAQSQTLNELTVASDVDVCEVTQKTTTLTYQQEKTTTRVVVVLVLFEVLGEILDALGKQGNLNLGGSSITGVSCVFFDDRL